MTCAGCHVSRLAKGAGTRCAKCYHTSARRPEQARVDPIELPIDETVQLRVTRRVFAEKRRRHDAVDVERVARMLAVGDRVVNQGLLIVDPGELGKVHHRVRVVLLRARVRVRKERVYPVYPC